VGIVLGLLAAATASRTLMGLLYGIGPLDLVAFLAAALILIFVVLAASLIPARKAVRIDPMDSIRRE
jgi:ABC-type antimicrobial peptide transport system permease subunit